LWEDLAKTLIFRLVASVRGVPLPHNRHGIERKTLLRFLSHPANLYPIAPIQARLEFLQRGVGR
jgi:hypothetical protein